MAIRIKPIPGLEAANRVISLLIESTDKTEARETVIFLQRWAEEIAQGKPLPRLVRGVISTALIRFALGSLPKGLKARKARYSDYKHLRLAALVRLFELMGVKRKAAKRDLMEACHVSESTIEHACTENPDMSNRDDITSLFADARGPELEQIKKSTLENCKRFKKKYLQ